jgi:hypothetical protein
VVTHRNIFAVDGAGIAVTRFIRREMGDDLMAEKNEVHPLGRTYALGATEQRPVERASLIEAVDREGEMKGWQR